MNLNKLYNDYSSNLPSDHENELQANSRFTNDASLPPYTTHDGRDQTSNSKSKPQQNSHCYTASVPPDNSDDSEVEIGTPCPKMNSQIPETQSTTLPNHQPPSLIIYASSISSFSPHSISSLTRPLCEVRVKMRSLSSYSKCKSVDILDTYIARCQKK